MRWPHWIVLLCEVRLEWSQSNAARPGWAGARRQSHIIRLSLCSLSLLVKDRVHLPFTKQTMPDRYPQPRGRIIRRTEQTGSINVSRPRPPLNQKKDPLRNMQTFGTTGKNLQHRLPQALRVWLHSLHSPACCRRGQVQRGFINSLKSVANRGPQPQTQKCLCFQ